MARYEALDKELEASPRRLPLNPIFNRNRFQEVTARHFRFTVVNQVGKQPRVDRIELLPAGAVATDRQAVIEFHFPEPKPVRELRFSSDARRGNREGTVTVYRLEASEDGQTWRLAASSLDHIGRNEFDLPKVSESELSAALTAEARQARRQLLDEQAAIQARMDQGPQVATVYAAKPRAAMKSHVLERGNVKRPLEEVTPGTLQAVGWQAPVDQDPRMALADWVASPKNPLTARVIVNRVWYHLFGAGIVNTPSDFGFNGDRPSHPELLDWLAVSFMENGWSLKWLHRLIVTSQAYQQAPAMNPKAFAVDAGNRLVWRVPLRRMDAETLRDSILAVSGALDRTAGGPGFKLQKKETHDYIYRALDNDGPPVWRRSVYRFVVRGGERIMMDRFDCPDPSVATPQRPVSNTPVQALTLMNNPFVIRQAGVLAERLRGEAGEKGAQVRRAYELVLGRQPAESELARDLRFLESQPLAAFTRVLLNSNEFVYVP